MHPREASGTHGEMSRMERGGEIQKETEGAEAEIHRSHSPLTSFGQRRFVGGGWTSQHRRDDLEDRAAYLGSYQCSRRLNQNRAV